MRWIPRSKLLMAAAIVVVTCVSPMVASGVAAATDTDGDGLTNAFERNVSHTDPKVADTDHNGVPDGQEDPDADGLSNLGEQRFGTSPLLADTDGDGTSDWSEDANGNGVPDGQEQDDRDVPAHLRPTLASAPTDRPPSYDDGCHVRGNQQVFHHCIYGNAGSHHTVALFGDSHAAQWLPAVIAAAGKLGWKVLSLTRSACPSADVTVWSVDQKGIATWCNAYRRQAVRWLQQHPPDVVILSNLAGTMLYRKNGQQITVDRVESAWESGLGRTLDALPTRSRAIVLADTPYPGVEIPACLRANPNSIAACERPRAQNTNSIHAAVEANTAAKHGAAFADLAAETCSYDPCPVLAGSVIMWSDHSHMTATFSRLLGPSIRKVIQAALGG